MCAQSCPALCDPMDYSPPGSSVHGIFQARILKELPFPSLGGSSLHRTRTCISCIGRRILNQLSHWGSLRWMLIRLNVVIIWPCIQILSHYSFVKSCPTLRDPMDCSIPGFPVLHYLPESAQTHEHWVNDIIQPSHPLLLPSPSALNPSQHQGLFQWVGSSHQVAKVFEFQHQSFQWIFKVDFL